MRVLEPISSPDNSTLRFVCSTESAACISAYVDLARIASQYSRLVNVTLKNNPASCLDGMRELNRSLDMFSARWLRQRECSAVIRLIPRFTSGAQIGSGVEASAFAVQPYPGVSALHTAETTLLARRSEFPRQDSTERCCRRRSTPAVLAKGA